MQRLRVHHRRAVVAGVVAILLLATLGGTVLIARGAGAPSFSADVQPIFDAKCVACHPTAYEYLDLRRGRSYGSLYRVSAATRPAFERVVPGRPELSYLLIHPPDPSNLGLLSDEETDVIAEWIRAGAKDD
ncbi:MAG: hypothetical protein ACKVUT_14985 [Gaiella sp.]